MLLLLAACAPAEADLPVGCVDAPVVTWDTFGEGFVLEQCQGCHASTTVDRYGAPGEVTFDTVDDVWARADDVLAVAAGADAAMPPSGPAPEDDRTLLTWWLTCAAEGT